MFFLTASCLLYTVLILSWPWHPARYLMPLFPVVLLSLFQGAQAATAVIRPCATEHLVCRDSSICNPHPYRHCCGFNSGMALELYPTRPRGIISPCGHGFRASYGWTGFGETFSWIKQNTRSDDVLATAYDPMYYLYTGRKAVRPWIHRPETYFYPYRQRHARSRIG